MTVAVQAVRKLASEIPSAADLRRMAGMEKAVGQLLLGGVMPLWLSAGLADWYQHRRTQIERTAGPRESAIHSLLFAETGVPILLGLFCEVNAGTLVTAYAAVGAHSATAYWDQIYAQQRRRVSPVEQHVHSLLEVSPVMAAVMLTACTGIRPRRWPGKTAARRGSGSGSSAATRCRHRSGRRCSRPFSCSACCPTPRSCGGAGGPAPPSGRYPRPPNQLPTPCASPNRDRALPARTPDRRSDMHQRIVSMAVFPGPKTGHLLQAQPAPSRRNGYFRSSTKRRADIHGRSGPGRYRVDPAPSARSPARYAIGQDRAAGGTGVRRGTRRRPYRRPGR